MKSMSKCLYVVFIVLFCGSLLFAAGQQEKAVDGGPTKIDFWYSVGGNPRAATEALTEKFNESQDEVFVEATYSGSYEDTTQKLLGGVVTGETPVIAHMAMAYTAQFIIDGYFEGLNSYISNDPDVNKEDFIQELLELNEYKGEVYGVPFNCSNPVMYYNKDLFREAGLDPENPPETWDEAFEASKKISALGDDIYGFNVERGSGWISQGYTWQFGGDWIAEDNSTVLWTEPEAVEALTFMQNMVNSGAAVYMGGAEMDESGKSGMVMRSTASLTDLLDAVKFDLGVAESPYKVRKQVPIGGGSLFVFKNASEAEKEAAWKYLKFMSSAESQLYWAEQTGYQVSSVEALNSDELQNLFERDPRYEVTYKQVPYSVAEDQTKLIPFLEVRDVFNEAWDTTILNNSNAEKEMENAQKRANSIINEYY